MLSAVFGFPAEKGMQHAEEVDASGRTILITTSREHAELKQEQVHAFGPDPFVKKCSGSMSCTIEPAP
jgi:ATP-dependent Clp protease adaptor protein ClpS